MNIETLNDKDKNDLLNSLLNYYSFTQYYVNELYNTIVFPDSEKSKCYKDSITKNLTCPKS